MDSNFLQSAFWIWITKRFSLLRECNTLYNAEISIFANIYTTYGPQNREIKEEQH